MHDFSKILCATPKGLFCPPGDFYVDPTGPVARAVVTHGHSDHARSGHGAVLATKETLAIMAVRYGEAFAEKTQAASYGEAIRINGVGLTLVPAGHVLGSAQAVIVYGGRRLVVSGDYKRRRDPTCSLFEPVRCDVFVTEATFALPVFRHPEDKGEIAKLLSSVAQFPERTHLVGAYALGKAQRLLCLLREAGYEKPVYLHGSMQRLCALYEDFGVRLGPLAPATVESAGKSAFAGEIVLAPPSAIQERWARRFSDPLPAFASGWMNIRARARQRGVELPLILSDHADWTELTETIDEVEPREVWVTHGRDDALLRWAELKGLKAKAVPVAGYEDEDD